MRACLLLVFLVISCGGDPVEVGLNPPGPTAPPPANPPPAPPAPPIPSVTGRSLQLSQTEQLYRPRTDTFYLWEDFSDPDGRVEDLKFELRYLRAFSSALLARGESERGPWYFFEAEREGSDSVFVSAVDLDGHQAGYTVTVSVSDDRPPRPVPEWSPSNTYTFYHPDLAPEEIAGLRWTMKFIRFPPESLHGKGLLHYYAIDVRIFEEASVYAGLQTLGEFNGLVVGPMVNFSIWGSVAADSLHVDAMARHDNPESEAVQIVMPTTFEVDREYEFELRWMPDEKHGYAWRLSYEGELVGRILTSEKLGKIEFPWATFGEDMHWWHTQIYRRGYECNEFEPSSLQFLNMRMILKDGDVVRVPQNRPWSLTSADWWGTVEGSNGITTTFCTDPFVEKVEGGAQHNLGYHNGRGGRE